MLWKKLFRTLWVYKAQFISMVIMIAIGVGIFFAFNVEWYSLEKDTAEIYEATGFADFRVYSDRGFNDADRENTSSYYLKVPIKDANYQYYPVRVLRNGVDVTFDDNFLDEFADDYLIYKVNMRVDETWDISRDTSHKQTFIVKGGTNGEDVEIEYSYPIDAYDTDVYPAMDGKPHHLDFPAYDSEHAPGAIITIDVKEGNSFTVLRNGVNIKDKFSLVTGSAGASAGYTRYRLSEAANGGSDTQEALGFQFRDPAVWQITIGDTDRFDVNRDGSISIADVTTLVNKILGKPTN